MFDELAKQWKPRKSVLVTPSEVIPFKSTFNKWTHRLWVDTAMYGDTLCGVWNVLTIASFRVESLIQPHGVWTPGTFVELYARPGQRVLPGVNDSNTIRKIPNSFAQVASYIGSGGRKLCSTTSQLVSPSLTEVRESCLEWPRTTTQRPPSIY